MAEYQSIDKEKMLMSVFSRRKTDIPITIFNAIIEHQRVKDSALPLLAAPDEEDTSSLTTKRNCCCF